MKKLVDVYKESKQDLRRQLVSVQSDPREVVQILQHKINEFINGEYLGSLTPPLARIAQALLLRLSILLNTLTLVTVEQVHPPDSDKSPRSKSSKELSAAAKVAAPLSGGALTAAGTIIFVGSSPHFVLLIALTAAIGSALGGFVAEKIFIPSEEEQIETDPNTHVHPKVDIDALLIVFEEELYKIDGDIAMIYESQKPQKEPSKPHLTDLDDVLEFFHKFIGDASWERDQLPEFTGYRLNDLEYLLKGYGIEVKFYSKDIQLPGELDINETFDFEKTVISKIEESVTQYPAFLKEGKVLIRGLVSTP